MSRNSNNRVTGCLLLSLLGIVLLICFFPSDAESIYRINYAVDSFCLVISIMLIMGMFCRYELDIFDPIVTIGAIYIIMFFYTPIHDIINKIYLWYGYDLFSHGIKATLIAFAGFLSLYFFYSRDIRFNTSTFKSVTYYDELTRKGEIISKPHNKKMLIVLMYIVSFISNALYLVLYNGNSLLYFLSLGFLGRSGSATSDAPIGFLSMLSYSLPTITILYWEYGNSRLFKGLMFYAMLILQVARGFRFFVIQIAISFFTYYYLKNKKRPKLRTILLAAVVAMIPVILMTLFRDSIRFGAGINVEKINSTAISDAFDAAVWDNFRIYRNFYGMVDVIPSVYPYVFGRQIVLGTLIMFIPRILWPGKISSYGGVGLVQIIGSALRGTGQAYPTLGEYYYSMGVFGVVFFMSIYGAWARRQWTKKNNPKSILDIIEYSVLLGCNLQLIIRGYFPSNFWYLVFAVLPIIVIRHTD